MDVSHIPATYAGDEGAGIDLSKLDLPAWMRVMIDKTSGHETKAGDGKYVMLTMKVSGGPADGCPIYQRFMVKSRSEKALEIAGRHLGQIRKSLGDHLTDTSLWAGKEMDAKVVLESDAQYGDRLQCTSFRAAGMMVPDSDDMTTQVGIRPPTTERYGQAPSPSTPRSQAEIRAMQGNPMAGHPGGPPPIDDDESDIPF